MGYTHLNNAKRFEGQSFPILTNRIVFGLSTICIIMSFLLTASDRRKYSLERGKLCSGTVKINSLSGDFVIAGFEIAGFCFHIFYCNSAGLSNVVGYNGVFVIVGFLIAGCHCTILFLV